MIQTAVRFIAFLIFISSIQTYTIPYPRITIAASTIQQDVQKISEQIPQSIKLDNITYQTDVHIDRTEFLYVTNLQESTTVSAQTIASAIKNLYAKHVFESIMLELLPSKHGSGVHVHITLKGVWRFKKLNLKGMLIGKDAYRQYYVIKKGDPFNTHKHELSLQRIKEVCKEEGYFGAHITSDIIKDPVTKTVIVTITLHRGKKYTITAAQVSVQNAGSACNEDVAFLQQRFKKQFMHALVGSSYSNKRVAQTAKALKQYATRKGFLQVGIELKEQVSHAKLSVDLLFAIEVWNKKEFVFFGNHFFTRNQLLDQLLAFGPSAWMLPPELLAEDLMQVYRKKGFWNAEIEAKEEGERHLFVIQEHKRAVIDSVALRGIEQFEAGKLIKQFFSKLLRSKSFDQEAITESIDRLVAFYLDQGYWQCTVIHKECVPLNENNKYELVVALDEGLRSFIDSVTITPFPELQNQGLFAKIGGQEKIPFTVNQLQKQRTYLEAYMQEQGYGKIPIRSEIIRKKNNVSIVWNSSNMQHTQTFGKTIMQGSSTLPFAYILRELQYKEGQPFDTQLLHASRTRLQELGIFEHVHLYPEHSIANELEQPIILDLHHDDRFELRIRAGLGLQQLAKHTKFGGLTYKAGGSFFIKNPFNRADQLRFDADVTRSYQKIEGRYVQPWLAHFPIRTTMHGYANRYQQPGLLSGRKSLYEFWQRGLLVGLHRKWRLFELGANAGVEWMRTTICKQTVHNDMFNKKVARALNFEPALLDRNIPYVVFEPTLFLDLLDNSIDPTKGSLTVLSCKSMIPISVLQARSYFVKLLGEQSLFIPLKPFVLALHARVGHIFHQKFENIMPAERFYLGGAHSIRSYETDMCPPLGCVVNEQCKDNRVPQGARSLLHTSAEVRFPLYKRVRGAFFQDIGLLSNNVFTDIKREKVLAGTGFGIRIATPLGPLRFDIAWKWFTADKQESSYAWFLTFGHAF